MEYVIITLIIVIILLIYGIHNLMIKYETLEDEVLESDTFIETIITPIQKAYLRMKAIDRIGSFESDDETGFIFEEIKSTMELLNKRLNLDGTEEKE
jgi:uncharacterized membrane protein